MASAFTRSQHQGTSNIAFEVAPSGEDPTV